jgi:hypothetical protein
MRVYENKRKIDVHTCINLSTPLLVMSRVMYLDLDSDDKEMKPYLVVIPYHMEHARKMLKTILFTITGLIVSPSNIIYPFIHDMQRKLLLKKDKK